MPSSKNYKRDYRQEYATAKARGENDGNAQRKRARYAAEKAGRVHKGDGKDIDHKRPISRGGTNAASNLRVVSKGKNRSFPRRADGSMK